MIILCSHHQIIKVSIIPKPHQHFLSSVFTFSHPCCCVVISHCVLINPFLTGNDAEHLYICLFGLSSFAKFIWNLCFSKIIIIKIPKIHQILKNFTVNRNMSSTANHYISLQGLKNHIHLFILLLSISESYFFISE